MSRRVALPVSMELCSDAIFGSGYSIPGGEDVAVCRNEAGFPYINGSTWKGLLRESLENLVTWGEGGEADLEALLGVEDWLGLTDGRRIQLTELTLADPPIDPEDCFDLRTFTSLEGGVAKTGTLRTAACVRTGLAFDGVLYCDERDEPLLRNALAGIKWAGTQRSRGFGRVRLTAGESLPVQNGVKPTAGACLRFRLRASLPLILTDPNHSYDNSYDTYGLISGSAVRGAVMERLSAQDPDWFNAHKTALLGDGTRFLDAIPLPDPSLIPLPSLRGFYEDKEESQLESVVSNGEFTPGFKRSKLGSFCALKGDTLRYWSAKIGGVTRIRRGKNGEDTQLFQVRYLSEGQEFEGYILLDDSALGEKISQALGETLWLGADRYAGYGECQVTVLETHPYPAWLDAYGYAAGETPGEELYLLAVSPFTMINETGDPCGLDEKQLSQKLGVDKVCLESCATALTQFGGYNRIWQSRAPAVRFYDRGSLFRLKCTPAPNREALSQVQAEGLGIRRAEGFGQVLFLPPALVERLTRKSKVESGVYADAETNLQALLRRARYTWVMEHTDELNNSGLSKSQVGTIQSLCEKEKARSKKDKGYKRAAELEGYLSHNLENRGALHRARFQQAAELIRSVVKRPLGETLELETCPDSLAARLELLCLLFDHSRKRGKEAEAV